jgi:hypothetical protein
MLGAAAIAVSLGNKHGWIWYLIAGLAFTVACLLTARAVFIARTEVYIRVGNIRLRMKDVRPGPEGGAHLTDGDYEISVMRKEPEQPGS